MIKIYIEFHVIFMSFKGFYLRKNECFGVCTVKFDYNFANYVLLGYIDLSKKIKRNSMLLKGFNIINNGFFVVFPLKF